MCARANAPEVIFTLCMTTSFILKGPEEELHQGEGTEESQAREPLLENEFARDT